jgi:hypothetical protein
MRPGLGCEAWNMEGAWKGGLCVGVVSLSDPCPRLPGSLYFFPILILLLIINNYYHIILRYYALQLPTVFLILSHVLESTRSQMLPRHHICPLFSHHIGGGKGVSIRYKRWAVSLRGRARGQAGSVPYLYRFKPLRYIPRGGTYSK